MIRVSYITHKGLIRTDNEDNICVVGTYLDETHSSMEMPIECEIETSMCVVAGVFDGIGGEWFGSTASALAAHVFASSAIDALGDFIEAFENANERVFEESRHRKARMGTTASLFLFAKEKLFLGNIGDSPAFVYGNSRLRLISESHTNKALLESLGLTDARPSITKYLGMSKHACEVKPYILELTPNEGNYYLAASDGLTESLGNDEIEEVLSMSCGLSEKVSTLCDRALVAGGRDNITIVLCEYTV